MELKKYTPTPDARRLQQVKELMLEGVPFIDIVEWCASQGMDAKQTRALMERVGDEWRDMGAVGDDHVLGYVRSGMMHLYRKMVADGAWADAARVLVQLSKL